MGRLGRLSAIVTVFVVGGCVSVDEDARDAISALNARNDAKAIVWSDKLADESHYSRNLGAVESGRVNLLAGNYEASEMRFRAAVDSAVERSETAPKLKGTDLANTVMASTITDDRTRDYYLPPYELNLALEYGIIAQALNGRLEDALVDARLSVYVQDALAETYGADIAKAGKDADKTAQKIIDNQNKRLEDMIAATRNSWENPVLWWLTGILFEADGQTDFAWQSYRKAVAIQPDNAVFAKDAERAETAVSPARDKAKLVVVYDQGFVPRRESLKIPIPIYTGMAIDIPMYSDDTMIYDNVAIAGSAGAPVAATRALDVRSLAARDLKEKLPGVIVRNVTRAAVQASAQAAVNAAGNDYAKIAMFAGNMVVSAIRRADVRSWCTLPKAQQIWCDGEMLPGTYDVELQINGTKSKVRIPLAAGETRLLWIANSRGTLRGASATIGGRGHVATDLNGKEINK
jgi:hypothetical protein